jgi:hypothetical protein
VNGIDPIRLTGRTETAARIGQVVQEVGTMISPYGMEIVENCISCKVRADRIFCNLPQAALETFESIKFVTA